MLHSKKEAKYTFKPDTSATPLYGSLESDFILPREVINKSEVNPDIAYRLLADEMMHDGNPRYNLCTFVQTFMEPNAKQVMVDTMATNAIDKAEYPQTTEIEHRCVNIIANLWNAPKNEHYMGTSTVGSSEACMLGGMAMKFRWRKRAEALGIDIKAKKPNLIISSGFQVVWEKFCVYWDVELREIPMEKDCMRLDPEKTIAACDEYTIGIVPIMGITYTGGFDDVVALNEKLNEYNKTAKISVPLHIDAASGGLYLPFVNPELEWDFRLNNVVSISTSGHKFGLVYPGIGWVLWRDSQYLPEELLFKVDYLGSFEPTFQINFSRPGSQIWAQYYNFVRWGFEGYKAVHERSRDVGLFLTKSLIQMGIFNILNDGKNIPIVCWSLKEDPKRKWTAYELQDRLRTYGWQIPAYTLPKNLDDTVIMRVVVRADQSMEQMSLFLEDMKASIEYLEKTVGNTNIVHEAGKKAGYTHNETRLKK